MFVIVAIVALITTIEGDVLEYSDQFLKELTLTDALAGDMKAEVINADIEIDFSEIDKPQEDAVYLAPVSTPYLSNSDVCGGKLGIKLTDTEDVYCSIDVFGIEVDFLENNKETLQLGLLFQSQSKTAKPLVLDVPIFIQPSEYVEADKQKEFEAWASETKVSIVAPIDLQTLSDIGDKKETKLTFKWLSHLLSFGVTKSKEPLFLENSEEPADSYVSRPIVISKDLAEKFKSVIETLHPGTDLYIDWDENSSEESRIKAE